MENPELTGRIIRECPDCGRVKALSLADVSNGLCPKWYCINDAAADLDCQKHRPKIAPESPFRRPNVISTFGMFANMEAAVRMFEEMQRGQARTESVIQQMNDGDVIVVAGRHAYEDAMRRLKDRGLRDCVGIDVIFDHQFNIRSLGDRVARAATKHNGNVFLDHSFVEAFMMDSIKAMKHQFAGIVGLIGGTNSDMEERRRKPLDPRPHIVL